MTIFPYAQTNFVASAFSTTDVVSAINVELNLRGSEVAIAAIVAEGNAKQFATRGARSGDTWVGTATLVDTGKMREVALHPIVQIDPSNNFRAVVTYAGDHVELIAKHQFGQEQTRKSKRGSFLIRIPIRKVIAYTNDQYDKITKVAFDTLITKTQTSMGRFKK
jgi:hypothetical protein